MVKRLPLGVLSIGMLFTGLATRAAEAPATLAVMDFAERPVSRDTSPHRWLSKALSDLLIGDLSVAENLRVVNREHMHMLMQEAELRERSGLTEDRLDVDSFRRMKQYLKVDHLILGTFSIQDDNIRIDVRIVRYEDGEFLAAFSREGLLQDALALEKALARDLLSFFSNGKRPVDSWQLPAWTDSMQASEWLYQGVDAFDAGQYNEAWYAFRRAAEVDPAYADAHYWAGRMYYYRQDYAHARVLYRDFVRRFPEHARIGDAVAELVHSLESAGSIESPAPLVGRLEPVRHMQADDPSLTPEQALKLYRSLRGRDWGNARVHNKIDYTSRSPLADWLLKREQQALAYLGRRAEAFHLLEEGLRTLPDDPADDAARSWRNESRRLMAILALKSEDAGEPRLTSDFLEARDYPLCPTNPVAAVNLHDANLKGNQYLWGENRRILAPPGHIIRTLHTTIFRTVDPQHSSTCRLQIRRYRYVDIDSCAASGRGEPLIREHEKIIEMPYGLTWFYLRPEYLGRPSAAEASFDGWRVEAALQPIPQNAGALSVTVENAYEYNLYLNGVYTRCYDGRIPHLAPGAYTVSFGPMWPPRNWGFEPLQTQIEVNPGALSELTLHLPLSANARADGWEDPRPIAAAYPDFKHRPRPDSNWRSGPPAIVVHPRTGEYLAVWSHLDDLWISRSADGKQWDEPDILPPPVNSADAELNPRLIIDDQGRYCLLFLSNRGMFRNLASYISWSRNLRQWSRPVMLDPQHHDDHDLLQDDQGRYLLLLTPAEKQSDGAQDQRGMMTLRKSRDLIEWTEAVSDVAWRRIFFLQGVASQSEAQYLRQARPWKARIVQDRYRAYHLVWTTRGQGQVHYSRSTDLVEWSPSEHVSNNAVSQPFDLAMIAAGDRLLTALIASDGGYSGGEAFALSARALDPAAGVVAWRPLAIPPLVVNGMPDLAFDAVGERVTLAWQIAEQQLHPTRLSGPVFSMQGNPVAQSVEPARIQARHLNAGRILQGYIDRMRSGETLSKADLEAARTVWQDYETDLRRHLLKPNTRMRINWQGRLQNPNFAAYYLNGCRISVIDPERFRDKMAFNPAAHHSFLTLRDQIIVEGEQPELLAALVFSGLFKRFPGESLQALNKLETLAPFWAAHIRESLHDYARQAPRRRPYYSTRVASVNQFLKTLADQPRPVK